MTEKSPPKRVLAIDPTHCEFGYVAFEAPEFLIDWGVKNMRGPMNAGSLKAIVQLLKRCQPEVVIIEDTAPGGSRRRGRLQMFLRQIAREAVGAEFTVCRVSRADLMAEF
jgi:hypothetical protein